MKMSCCTGDESNYAPVLEVLVKVNSSEKRESTSKRVPSCDKTVTFMGQELLGNDSEHLKSNRVPSGKYGE